MIYLNEKVNCYNKHQFLTTLVNVENWLFKTINLLKIIFFMEKK